MTTPKFSGSTLVDENGTEVGQVKDVIYGSSETEPEWLVVKAGRLRGEHVVPAGGAWQKNEGQVVVPFPAEVIKAAPKAGKNHVLTKEQQAQLTQHYRLASS
ncbi:MAG: PRC-barrel domain-containing protein [Acidimicrobiia bacterium]|nr:PRC-barrel domain-containing protein [Acidimicrobiia bacterium]